MLKPKFGTAINCMDGRVQEPVMRWMQSSHRVAYVDTITEAGPIRNLSTGTGVMCDSVRHRLGISIEKHGSKVVAVVGHHDCAGNPVSRAEQVDQIKLACEVVHGWFPGVEVYGLYVNQIWQVESIGKVIS